MPTQVRTLPPPPAIAFGDGWWNERRELKVESRFNKNYSENEI
jgi:hypothetical protein